GVKIVTGPRIAVPVRAGVACSPIHKIEFGVVATGGPDRTAAVLPRFASPCFVTRFAGLRDDMEAPLLISGFSVESCDLAANSVFASSRAEDYLVFHDKWRHGERVVGRKPCVGRFHFHVENLSARFRIDGNEVRVDRGQVQSITLYRETLVVAATAGSRFSRSV